MKKDEKVLYGIAGLPNSINLALCGYGFHSQNISTGANRMNDLCCRLDGINFSMLAAVMHSNQSPHGI